eukprot:g3930.t1
MRFLLGGLIAVVFVAATVAGSRAGQYNRAMELSGMAGEVQEHLFATNDEVRVRAGPTLSHDSNVKVSAGGHLVDGDQERIDYTDADLKRSAHRNMYTLDGQNEEHRLGAWDELRTSNPWSEPPSDPEWWADFDRPHDIIKRVDAHAGEEKWDVVPNHGVGELGPSMDTMLMRKCEVHEWENFGPCESVNGEHDSPRALPDGSCAGGIRRRKSRRSGCDFQVEHLACCVMPGCAMSCPPGQEPVNFMHNRPVNDFHACHAFIKTCQPCPAGSFKPVGGSVSTDALENNDNWHVVFDTTLGHEHRVNVQTLHDESAPGWTKTDAYWVRLTAQRGWAATPERSLDAQEFDRVFIENGGVMQARSPEGDQTVYFKLLNKEFATDLIHPGTLVAGQEVRNDYKEIQDACPSGSAPATCSTDEEFKQLLAYTKGKQGIYMANCVLDNSTIGVYDNEEMEFVAQEGKSSWCDVCQHNTNANCDGPTLLDPIGFSDGFTKDGAGAFALWAGRGGMHQWCEEPYNVTTICRTHGNDEESVTKNLRNAATNLPNWYSKGFFHDLFFKNWNGHGRLNNNASSDVHFAIYDDLKAGLRGDPGTRWESCEDALTSCPPNKTGTFKILGVPVYCENGWELAMRFSDESQFVFKSEYWENDEVLNADALRAVDAEHNDEQLDLVNDNTDAKFPSFNSVKATRIRGCLPNGCREYDLPDVHGQTLRQLFREKPSSNPRVKWEYPDGGDAEARKWCDDAGVPGPCSRTGQAWYGVGINYDNEHSVSDARVRFGVLVGDGTSVRGAVDAVGFGASSRGSAMGTSAALGGDTTDTYSGMSAWLLGAGATHVSRSAATNLDQAHLHKKRGTIWIKRASQPPVRFPFGCTRAAPTYTTEARHETTFRKEYALYRYKAGKEVQDAGWDLVNSAGELNMQKHHFVDFYNEKGGIPALNSTGGIAALNSTDNSARRWEANASFCCISLRDHRLLVIDSNADDHLENHIAPHQADEDDDDSPSKRRCHQGLYEGKFRFRRYYLNSSSAPHGWRKNTYDRLLANTHFAESGLWCGAGESNPGIFWRDVENEKRVAGLKWTGYAGKATDNPWSSIYPSFSFDLPNAPYDPENDEVVTIFKVPAGRNMFDQTFDNTQQRAQENFVVTNVRSAWPQLKGEDQATFCHACSKGGVKWGGACWGLTPTTDTHRGCGCSNGGPSSEGAGVYYGGYGSADAECSDDHQKPSGGFGGFVGGSLSGQGKAGALPGDPMVKIEIAKAKGDKCIKIESANFWAPKGSKVMLHHSKCGPGEFKRPLGPEEATKTDPPCEMCQEGRYQGKDSHTDTACHACPGGTVMPYEGSSHCWDSELTTNVKI